MNATWKHRDLSYNEINDEMERQTKVAVATKPDGDVKVINDLEDSSMDEDEYDSDSTPDMTPVRTKRSGSLAVTSAVDNGQVRGIRRSRDIITITKILFKHMV